MQAQTILDLGYSIESREPTDESLGDGRIVLKIPRPHRQTERLSGLFSPCEPSINDHLETPSQRDSIRRTISYDR